MLGSGGGGIGAPMPPLFALALGAVGAVVGHSAMGMRALPVLMSVAAVPLAYVVGARAAGSVAGLSAALCFAASPTALLHGQELKQYSTDVAVVLVLLVAASTVAPRPSRPRSWIALAVVMSLAPAVSFPSALVLPGIALATLACCTTSAERRRWLAAHVVSGSAALAWYALVIGPQRNRPLVTAYWAGEFPPLDGVPGAGWVTDQLLDFISYCSLHPRWLAAAVVVAGLALASRWLGIAALVSVATLIAAAAWRAYPLSGGRTSVFLLPFVYLGLGSALGGIAAKHAARRQGARTRRARDRRPRRRAPHARPRRPRARRRGRLRETVPLIAVLDAERQPTDRVYVYDGGVQAFRFHHPALDPTITLGGSHRNDQTAYAAEVQPLLVPGQRLWLLFAHVHTPPGGARSAIRSSPTWRSMRARSRSARRRARRCTSSRSRAPQAR